MLITFAATQCQPYIISTEAAHKIYSFCKELAKDNEIAIYLPYYKSLKQKSIGHFIGSTSVIVNEQEKYVGLFLEQKDNINFFFIDNNEYFDYNELDGLNNDAERFIFYQFAILESFKLTNRFPDILHITEWKTSIIPYILKSKYKYKDAYRNIKTVLSIQDFSKQGVFDSEIQHIMDTKTSKILIQDDKLNFLKAGLMEADQIIFDSKSYLSSQIINKSNSLSYLLTDRDDEISTISFGLDDSLSPEKSNNIYLNYNIDNFVSKKRENKEKFKKEYGFSNNDVMLACFIGPFDVDNGFDIFSEALYHLLDTTDVQFFFLGYGEYRYQELLDNLQNRYPDRFKVHIGQDRVIMEKLLASSDIILLPSKKVTCGLITKYAMRFGTIPLAYEFASNNDIIDAFNMYDETGNGFSFSKYHKDDFLKVFSLAYGHYRFSRDSYNNIIRRAMQYDSSFKKTISKYYQVYNKVKK